LGNAGAADAWAYFRLPLRVIFFFTLFIMHPEVAISSAEWKELDVIRNSSRKPSIFTENKIIV
jgi:hypothetical protein